MSDPQPGDLVFFGCPGVPRRHLRRRRHDVRLPAHRQGDRQARRSGPPASPTVASDRFRPDPSGPRPGPSRTAGRACVVPVGGGTGRPGWGKTAGMSTVPVPPVAAPEVKLAVDVWADLTCAWCYLGKRRLERAITAFEHPHAVRVRYRSFERLWPEGTVAPVTGAGDAYAAALFSPARAKSAAADEGLRPGHRERRTGEHVRCAPADASRRGRGRAGPAGGGGRAHVLGALLRGPGAGRPARPATGGTGGGAGRAPGRGGAGRGRVRRGRPGRPARGGAAASCRRCRSCWPTGGSRARARSRRRLLLLLREAWKARAAGGASG